MYIYAVKYLNIQSITHKYLIRGHTQNDGDVVHSVIERAVKKAKKSGPIYVPDQYISLIRTARKKGNAYIVNELTFSDFSDLKSLYERLNFQHAKNNEGKEFKISEVKLLKFEKNSDYFYYKESYAQAEWKSVCIQRYKRRSGRDNAANIDLVPAYTAKISLSERKRNDLISLINTNIIPKYYQNFFNSVCE